MSSRVVGSIALGVALALACGKTGSSPRATTQMPGSGGTVAGSNGGASPASNGGASPASNGGALAGTATSTKGGAGAGVDEPGAGAGGVAVETPAEAGEGGGPAVPVAEQPSCANLALPHCGVAQADCCAALEVPGGSFPRFSEREATVSDFRLEKFEVTVGRFRAFVESYPDAVPAPHSGKNPNDVEDMGWNEAWTTQLPPSAAELSQALQCAPVMATWTDAPGANEQRPINCVSWYEAAAFCIWDGGRLPSDIEWEYALRGGSEARYLPWGNAVEPAEHAFANYRNFCEVDAMFPRPECEGVAQIWNVGSRPAGDGRWGHSDLAGNLWEFVSDFDGPGLSCVDCARHTPRPGSSSSDHVARSGAYLYDLGDGLWNRDFYYPKPRVPTLGLRCAHDALPK